MSKSTRKKKSVSKKSSVGKNSNDKGKNFEDAVADLYRLLGAKVTQNVMILQKKVDIFAELPVSASDLTHRIIVECKDEKIAVNQNQRVMQFKGLLTDARAAGKADSAEIITRVPWGDQAKGYALESGVRVFTYLEKLAQLISFKDYLQGMIDRFEKADDSRPDEPPLLAYYVDLSGQYIEGGTPKKIEVVNSFIDEWIKGIGTPHVAILGEFGAGKSSLCLKVARDIAKKYLDKPEATRIPIILNLREFTKTLKIEALITAFLDEECDVPNPRYRLFKAMNDAGMFLLIFDGLDEMASKTEADILEANLQEIEKLSAAPASKVIITSRPEYFISAGEELKALNPSLNLLRSRQVEYKPLLLLPWEEKHIEEFLKKRVPLIKDATETWDYYLKRIRSLPNLWDLSQRPVLLEMVVKTLPQLISGHVPINLPNLYETYLIGEIKRQKIAKGRTLLITDESRFEMLENLAIDFYCGAIKSITFTEASARIEHSIKPTKNEQESYTRDFLTCSFLIRKEDEFLFSHKSFLEYFVAKRLMKEIDSNKPKFFGRCFINPVVIGFLVEFGVKPERLWEWVALTKSDVAAYDSRIASNAVTILCTLSKDELAGRDLSNLNLPSANLTNADIRGCNLQSSLLRRAILLGAKFNKEEIFPADITDAILGLRLFIKLQNSSETLESRLDALQSWTAQKDLDFGSFKGAEMMGLSLTTGTDPLLQITYMFRVENLESIENARNIISQKIGNPVHLYYEEYKEFEKYLVPSEPLPLMPDEI